MRSYGQYCPLSRASEILAERMEVTPEHADPDAVLWSWCHTFVQQEGLPEGRVVVRFEAEHRGRRFRAWLLVQDGDVELCRRHPGFEEDLVVAIHDPQAFASWHLGFVEWGVALRAGVIHVAGRPDLAAALPTWNAGPRIHARARREHTPPPSWMPGPDGGIRRTRRRHPFREHRAFVQAAPSQDSRDGS